KFADVDAAGKLHIRHDTHVERSISSRFVMGGRPTVKLGRQRYSAAAASASRHWPRPRHAIIDNGEPRVGEYQEPTGPPKFQEFTAFFYVSTGISGLQSSKVPPRAVPKIGSSKTAPGGLAASRFSGRRRGRRFCRAGDRRVALGGTRFRRRLRLATA